MIRIFIGYDSVETIAYHVLQHSILTNTQTPVSFTPIGNELLHPVHWDRPRGKKDSTEFSNIRFLVPRLCDYKGWAIFMDCDMLCEGNIADLWNQRDDKYAVMVRKHSHHVKDGAAKFLGHEQRAYTRKNWSSLMLINCAHPRWGVLAPELAGGLDMHQFAFLYDQDIGAIEGRWNELLVPGESGLGAKLSHFTLGGPWHGWCQYATSWGWTKAFSDMLRGNNPRAHVAVTLDQHGCVIGGSYSVSKADAEAEAKASAQEENAA